MTDLTVNELFLLCAMLTRYSHQLTLEMRDCMEQEYPNDYAKLNDRQQHIAAALAAVMDDCNEKAFPYSIIEEAHHVLEKK